MRFERAKRHAALAQMQQIVAHLRLAQQVGRALIMRGERTNPLEINCLRGGRQSGEPHVFDHLRAQRCHQGDPLFEP
jgi:hypothetical protein